MRQVQRLRVTISPVPDRAGEYVAHWSSDFAGATFAVHFQDTILGALALTTFAEMLKDHYQAKRIEFQLTGPATGFHSPALVDLIGRLPARPRN